MALDVWVGDWKKPGSKRLASFEPEAYYHFLCPLFESLHAQGGPMIDLYDGAGFMPNALGQIFDLIDRAQEMVSAQPDQFEVLEGYEMTNVQGPKKLAEIKTAVDREAFLVFISELGYAATQAQQQQKPLHFYGD